MELLLIAASGNLGQKRTGFGAKGKQYSYWTMRKPLLKQFLSLDSCEFTRQEMSHIEQK